MRFPDHFLKNRCVPFSVLIIFFALAILPTGISAYVMGSPGYRIQSDSINVGGQDSASGAYELNDTLGEVGTGTSASGAYKIHAGYWQMQDSFISITSPSNLALSSIGGIVGEGTEGTTSWTVTTDSPAGYSLAIKAGTSPALQSGADSFADYTPAGADPDYTFSNLASDSSFGFSPEGTHVIARFKDNGSVCNTGSGETSARCWDGLSTTDESIAGSASGNHPSGTATTVRFRAESGASHIQTAGSYSATITVTATAL